MSRIVVQKFGGTSLDTARRRDAACHLVQERIEEGLSPIVVVSAIGRHNDPYATDMLQLLARTPGAEVDKRSLDLVSSCGEVISAVIFAQHLAVHGIPAVPLTGAQAGLVTTETYSQSQIEEVFTGRIHTLLNDRIVPVVAGFQGVTRQGEVTTLGRGGSDTSACVLGAAFNAEYVEIFTDVAGVMTADPRKVPQARLLNNAHFSEVTALAHKGAKVLEPSTLPILFNSGIPLWVKSLTGDGGGTRVDFTDSNRPVTGVASISNVVFFRIPKVTGGDTPMDSLVFRSIAERQISVHFISIRKTSITFVVTSSMSDEVSECLDESDICYTHDDGFSKVSVVGVGMTGRYGMMSTLIEALHSIGVNIYQASDSPTSISCLIRQDMESRALACLHDAFGLNTNSDTL